MARTAIWGAVGVIAVLLVVALYRPSSTTSASSFDRFAQHFSERSAAQPMAPLPSFGAAESEASPLSHASPPAEALLAHDAAAQARYDATAEAGEFVTPPSISIEH